MILAIIIFSLIIIYIVVEYNSFVNLSKKVEQSKSTIEVYLKQRFDLIPNLVEVVKGYANYEKETLQKVIEMRQHYINNSSNLEEGGKLNAECNKLLMLSEKYPDLKANEQFLNLQKNLTKMESQLQAARRIYNSDVTTYNTKISVVPTNILANIFGFKSATLFNIEQNEAQNVKIEL